MPYFFAISSCNDYNNSEELEALDLKVSKLQEENRKLKYLISGYEENELRYQSLVGITDGTIKVGKKNRIVFLFHSFTEMPKYEIFKLEGEKEVKIGTNNKTSFDYQFTPKSVSDNNLKVKVKIPYKKEVFEVFGEMNLKVAP